MIVTCDKYLFLESERVARCDRPAGHKGAHWMDPPMWPRIKWGPGDEPPIITRPTKPRRRAS